jgi:hypothetical protein
VVVAVDGKIAAHLLWPMHSDRALLCFWQDCGGSESAHSSCNWRSARRSRSCDRWVGARRRPGRPEPRAKGSPGPD